VPSDRGALVRCEKRGLKVVLGKPSPIHDCIELLASCRTLLLFVSFCCGSRTGLMAAIGTSRAKLTATKVPMVSSRETKSESYM
jgi:hypothetical protein